MKYLLLLSIFLSTSIFASKLKGRWSNCYSDEKNWDIEHIIEFGEKSKLEIFIAHVEKKERPCEGEIINYIATHWDIVVESDIIESTIFMTTAKALHMEGLSFFNKVNMCNKNQWKFNERVDCTNKKMGGLVIPAGHMMRHQFKFKGESLELTDLNGRVSVYKVFNLNP